MTKTSKRTKKQRKAAQPRIRGRGGYIADGGAAIGAYIGRALGSRFGPLSAAAGGALGGGIGKFAGRGIEKLTGRGDYATQANSLFKNSLLGRGSAPSFATTKADGSILVRRREYIQDITSGSAALVSGATPFQVNTYSINPGLPATFPWLSEVAENWEEYDMHGLVFHYVSLSADALNSTNTALGSVVAATQYNAASAAFTSKQQMENYAGAISARPSIDMLHGVECARGQTVMPSGQYIRTGSVPTGQDIKTYDLGTFSIATVGMQAINVKLGELWVTYEVELRVPKQTAGTIGAHYYSAAPTTAAPYGATQTTGAGSNLTLTMSGGAITFPSTVQSGTYQVTWTGHATSLTTNAVWGATSNCSVLNILLGGGASYQSAGTALSTMVSTFFITVTGPAPVVTMTTIPTIVAGDSMDLVVTQIANFTS